MDKGRFSTLSGKMPLILSASALLVGFLIVFIGLNFYKYLKNKQDFSSKTLQSITTGELERLESFFKRVNNQLTIIRDLGRNGVLNKADIISLNKKFIPLLNNQRIFSGVILADSTGWEYFLYREKDLWITRITKPFKQGSLLEFIQWKGPEIMVKKWQKKSDYDPRKRPWFAFEDDKVHWSAVYSFFQTGMAGVTASISWRSDQTSSPVTTVFAVDIPLSNMKQLLETKSNHGDILTFLLDVSSGKLITPNNNKLAGNKGIGEWNALLEEVVKRWHSLGNPENQPIILEFKSRKWAFIMQPIVSASKDLWLGVVVPEKMTLLGLKKALFSFDIVDAVVAVAGGLVLVFLVWRFGGLGRSDDKAVADPLMRLHDYINQGECDKVEFKSTVRTNLKSGKVGKEIEFAWLKAVVAFLNSEGGTLLIGIDDNGRIVGLEKDGFDNPDKCLLHVKNLINHHVGAEFSNFINTTIVEVEGKYVLMIECSPSKKPVFLKIGKNEEFYVRTGPSSVKLTPSQTISYLLHSGRLKAGSSF